MSQYVVGIDFGTDSVRAILVDGHNGQVVKESVSVYKRWTKGLYSDEKKHQFRQHPLDHLESLKEVLKEVVKGYEKDVVSMSVDATASTPGPIDENGTLLALLPEFTDEPDAMFQLWKDHTASDDAKYVNVAFTQGDVDYTQYMGDYSAEWYWAKVLHTIRHNRVIKDKAYMWVEHSDWVVNMLCGRTDPSTMTINACGAGHKAYFHSAFDGLPGRDCLVSLDPYLGDIYDRYPKKVLCAGEVAGTLTKEWCEELNLSPDVIIGVGAVDAHAGAVGAGIKPRTLVKVVGTSTCDMLIADYVDPEINTKPYCGIAENSIVPGYLGLEAGQASFGDTYAWLNHFLTWPLEHFDIPEDIIDHETKVRLRDYMASHMLQQLEANIYEDDELIATDWFNGRRYPFMDDTARATITKLHLGSMPPQVYRALIYATVFGGKRIYDSFVDLGLDIDQVICVGGISLKSSYIMQLMADSMNVPIVVSKETQACAKGAAIYAAVAAGLYDNVSQAQEVLCLKAKPHYFPDAQRHARLDQLYQKYLELSKIQ
ncbi:MAG: ribulokinase [Erysipelotrichaceae bacterium]|nr:ribulokinase [Erysipelotrichaceae bacterium]